MILRRKDENLKTKFEPSNNQDVKNKAHLDGSIIKIEALLPHLEKHYSEFKLQYNKKSVEEFLIQKAV